MKKVHLKTDRSLRILTAKKRPTPNKIKLPVRKSKQQHLLERILHNFSSERCEIQTNTDALCHILQMGSLTVGWWMTMAIGF